MVGELRVIYRMGVLGFWHNFLSLFFAYLVIGFYCLKCTVPCFLDWVELGRAG